MWVIYQELKKQEGSRQVLSNVTNAPVWLTAVDSISAAQRIVGFLQGNQNKFQEIRVKCNYGKIYNELIAVEVKFRNRLKNQ